MQNRICSLCHEFVDIGLFYKNQNSGNMSSSCRPCETKRATEKRKLKTAKKKEEKLQQKLVEELSLTKVCTMCGSEKGKS